MKKIFLGIETVGTHLGLALHDLDKEGTPCIARYFEPAVGLQAELLFPTLDRLMKSRRLKRSDLAAVAVDEGPGSFTGVRIGVSAGRALAQALRIPLFGVSSLEAMAWAADLPDYDAAVVARMPALATETYHAAYELTLKGWDVITPPTWSTDAEFEKSLTRFGTRPIAVIMIERAKADSFIPPAGAAVLRVPAPDPSALVSLAFARFGPDLPVKRFPVEKVVPVYLQPSWAERATAARKK